MFKPRQREANSNPRSSVSPCFESIHCSSVRHMGRARKQTRMWASTRPSLRWKTGRIERSLFTARKADSAWVSWTYHFQS